MKRFFVYTIVLLSFLIAGCNNVDTSKNENLIEKSNKKIKPIQTSVVTEDLFGYFNIMFDYDTFTEKDGIYSIKAEFYDKELYTKADIVNLKPGDTIIFNDGKDALTVDKIEKTAVPIQDTDLTYDALFVNDVYELHEGSGFYTLSVRDENNYFYRNTNESKVMSFDKGFILYTRDDRTIYDAKEAIEYLKSHPEADYSNTNTIIDGDNILAVNCYDE